MHSFLNKPKKDRGDPFSVPRVLLLTPSVRLLGARRSLLELVENLGSGWDPFVICSGQGGVQTRLADAGIGHAVVPHVAWRKGRYAVSRYVEAWRIAKHLGRFRPGLVHCNEYHSMPQAVAAARLDAWRRRATPPPIVVHVRLGMPESHARKYRLGEAARIVVVSRAVAELFREDPSLRFKVRVVYNGVNLRRFSPAGEEERREAREALGLSQDDFVVGLVGLVGPRKRQHVAVEALGRIRESCPGLHLVFAGEPFGSTRAYADHVKRLVAAKGLEGGVSLVGFREDVRTVYAAMDLNLLISEEEGFGRTIIESGAMEVPSIGTRIGGIPELIAEGKTGALTDLDDAEGLAGWIRLAYENRENWRLMGKRAREWVSERFSIEAHVRGMEGVWREVVEEKRCRGGRG